MDRQRLYLTVVKADMLGDTALPVVFVEAEKSALMLASVAMRTGRALCAIATGGCWGWRGRVGKLPAAAGGEADEKGPLTDFDMFNFEERTAIVWFDANVTWNPEVKAARAALVREIQNRKGSAAVINMPVLAGINGPDDFRANRDDAAVLEMLDCATAPKPGSHRRSTKRQMIVVELAR